MKKQVYTILSLIALALFLFRCSDTDNPSNPVTEKPAPEITALSIDSGDIGDPIEIYGKNFGVARDTSIVMFNGVQVAQKDYLFWMDTLIRVNVPEFAVSGNIVVRVNKQVSNGMPFFIKTKPGAPILDSISPFHGIAGDIVKLYGKNFLNDRGTSTVDFNGTAPAAGDYSLWTNTIITIKVPTGASTGNVTVTVDGQKSNGKKFIVAPPPSIQNINPTEAAAGDTITINGSNFGSQKNAGDYVAFGSAQALAHHYVSWTDSKIKMIVPDGTVSCNITVYTNGMLSNASALIVKLPPPVISSIDKTTLQIGVTITISGKNFGNSRGSNYVDFNGTKATEYPVWDNSIIKVKVPPNAASGDVAVWVDGVKSNAIAVTIDISAPVITSISPTSVQYGDVITINGNNFGAQANGYVMIGTVKPSQNDYSSWTNTQIKVKVPVTVGVGIKPVVVSASGNSSNSISITVIITNVDMVEIPSGQFTMGSINGTDWEKPPHTVKITKAFYMSKYEVTQKLWKLVFTYDESSKYQNDNNPTEQKNWLYALRFCNKLSQLEGKTPCYKLNGSTEFTKDDDASKITCDFNADGYRLPTEAEWEYACRAGTNSDFGVSGSNSEIGWFDNISDQPQPVGLKKANAWGLYDMHGNVIEWCWDGYDAEYYSKNPPTDDPMVNPALFPERVIRGGSFQDGADYSTSFHRDGFSAENNNQNTGFRIARKK